MIKLTSFLIVVASSAALDPLLSHLPIETQFTIAVKNGEADIVREILENKNYTIDVNVRQNGKTHLTRATINSLQYTHSFFGWLYTNPYVDVVRSLIKHGANPCILTRESVYFDGQWHEWSTTMDLYLHYAHGPRADIIRLIQCTTSSD